MQPAEWADGSELSYNPNPVEIPPHQSSLLPATGSQPQPAMSITELATSWPNKDQVNVVGTNSQHIQAQAAVHEAPSPNQLAPVSRRVSQSVPKDYFKSLGLHAGMEDAAKRIGPVAESAPLVHISQGCPEDQVRLAQRFTTSTHSTTTARCDK